MTRSQAGSAGLQTGGPARAAATMWPGEPTQHEGVLKAAGQVNALGNKTGRLSNPASVLQPAPCLGPPRVMETKQR